MNNSYNGHLCIVFALEHYNPLNMILAKGANHIQWVIVLQCEHYTQMSVITIVHCYLIYCLLRTRYLPLLQF